MGCNFAGFGPAGRQVPGKRVGGRTDPALLVKRCPATPQASHPVTPVIPWTGREGKCRPRARTGQSSGKVLPAPAGVGPGMTAPHPRRVFGRASGWSATKQGCVVPSTMTG
jgi:hypothetical protein